MSLPLTIHLAIISWENQDLNAKYISKLLSPYVHQLTVIHSCSLNSSIEEHAPIMGKWIVVSNDLFYGGKFKIALDEHQSDILLIIQADASFSNWPLLINACQNCFSEIPQLGIWASDANHSSWEFNDIRVDNLAEFGPQAVVQADGIVCAFSWETVQYLKSLNYEENRYGWGIDWAAITYAYCHNLKVMMDPSIVINHPEKTGYPKMLAFNQMGSFLEQLSPQQKVMYQLLDNYILMKRNGYALDSEALKKRISYIERIKDQSVQIQMLKNSNSWKITRPLRALSKLFLQK